MNYVFVAMALRMLLKENVKVNNVTASLLIAVGVFLTAVK